MDEVDSSIIREVLYVSIALFFDVLITLDRCNMSLAKYNEFLAQFLRWNRIYVISYDYRLITVKHEHELVFALDKCLGEEYVFIKKDEALRELDSIIETLTLNSMEYEYED